jgi:enterobactin synthetase component D
LDDDGVGATHRWSMLAHQDAPRILVHPVRQYAVRFDAARFSPDAVSALGIDLPPEVVRAVPKRRAEYLAGRICAREALQMLSPELAVDVRRLPSRAPSWPVGVTGSITHSGGFAWAAVAPCSHARALGVDTEAILSGNDRALAELVSTPRERADASMLFDERTSLTLLFSAKESVYKCLHPLVGTFFSFQHVRVSLGARSFRAELLVDLGDAFAAGTLLEGKYELQPPFVHTAVVLLR